MFGNYEDDKEFLQIHNNNPDKKTIEANGYIQAIRNASLEVYEESSCNNGSKWFRKINFSKMYV